MDGFRYDSKEGLACRLGVSSAQVRDPGPCKVIVQRREDKVGGHSGIERFVGMESVARDISPSARTSGSTTASATVPCSVGSILRLCILRRSKGWSSTEYMTHKPTAPHRRTPTSSMSTWSSLFNYCHRASSTKCALYKLHPAAFCQHYFNVLDGVKESSIAGPLVTSHVVNKRKVLLRQLQHSPPRTRLSEYHRPHQSTPSARSRSETSPRSSYSRPPSCRRATPTPTTQCQSAQRTR
ncbi:hypothetical protein C8Q76DRAFT_219792 [Earliella scabrosa]|nr:hypothetical protein C8Q76DRAFT_219792 [Earliella scabrosa]